MYTLNAFHWKNKKCLSTKGHLDVINGCWSESWRTLVVWKKRVVALLKLLSTYVEILQLSFKKVVGLLKLLIGIPERLWWSSDWGWMYRPDPLNQWFVEEGIKRINRPYSGLDVYILSNTRYICIFQKSSLFRPTMSPIHLRSFIAHSYSVHRYPIWVPMVNLMNLHGYFHKGPT